MLLEKEEEDDDIFTGVGYIIPPNYLRGNEARCAEAKFIVCRIGHKVLGQKCKEAVSTGEEEI